MLQRVTIVKLGGEAGKAGKAVSDMFARWDPQGVVEKDSLGERTVWPESCQKEMDRLVSVLFQHALDLPTMYFCQYADAWSLGSFVQCHVGGWPGLIEVGSAKHSLALVPVAAEEKTLKARLTKALRKRKMTQEDRWFLVNLREAVDAWSPLCVDSAIIVVRELLGGSWLNEEVEASAKVLPEWLRPEGPSGV